MRDPPYAFSLSALHFSRWVPLNFCLNVFSSSILHEAPLSAVIVTEHCLKSTLNLGGFATRALRTLRRHKVPLFWIIKYRHGYSQLGHSCGAAVVLLSSTVAISQPSLICPVELRLRHQRPSHSMHIAFSRQMMDTSTSM